MPRRHDPELLRAIGARLAELRSARHLTQEQLAERAGLEAATISRCEVGARALSLTNFVEVAEVLEVSLGDLLDHGRPSPAVGMSDEELSWLQIWRSIPEERRDLAVRMAREMTR